MGRFSQRGQVMVEVLWIFILFMGFMSVIMRLHEASWNK